MSTEYDFSGKSPRVILNELDQSILPEASPNPGLCLIGRARTGPAMKPITITSLDQFVEIFGKPIDGLKQNDPWREGNTGAVGYAGYAAQAYLASGVGPVKFVRLLGKTTGAATEEAGWTIGNTPAALASSNEAAYGLFLYPSGACPSDDMALTGTLGAIIYSSKSAWGISGTSASGSIEGGQSNRVSASCVMVSNAAAAGFSLLKQNGSVSSSAVAINFESTSPNYIRTVLDTDPTNLEANKNYNKVATDYFLGESFDVNVEKHITNVSSAAGEVHGFIMALGDGTTGYGDFQQELQPAKSGWFIGRYPEQRQLFRLAALDDGEEFQKNYYVRISGIVIGNNFNPVSKFTLQVVRRILNGPDQVVETHSSLNLKDGSPDHIAKRIGTRNAIWNTTSQTYTDDANPSYPNMSSYVRVEMGGAGLDGSLENLESDVPLGFLGPVTYPDQVFTHAQCDLTTSSRVGDYMEGSSSIGYGNVSGTFLQQFQARTGATLTVIYPKMKLTEKGAKAGSDFQFSNYFGLWHKKKNELRTNASFGDLARRRKAIDPHIANAATRISCSFMFSLEDIVSGSTGATTYYWESGSYDRSAGAVEPSIAKINGLTGAAGLIEGKKIKQFAAPFFGGADGINIKFANPFSNARLADGNTKYPGYSLEQAYTMVDSSEIVKYEMIAMPGIFNSYHVTNLVDQTSDTGKRADALAIIDTDGIARETYDNDGTATDDSETTAKTWIQGDKVPLSSYAACYFPSVWMRDTLNGNGAMFKCPPSVAGIGAIANSENLSQPWFAPAGFNRGGLSRLGGNLGPVVAGTCTHLSRDSRDELYELSINPIARFPSTGDTVVFGQKTLTNNTTSALSRINVRRMMLYLKRKIQVIADTILFDQNTQVTWNRFKTEAEKVCSLLKSEQGVTDYKIILDETTTSPELIDRNILLAQIMVKPARAIEYIVVDFVITQTGVEF